MAVKDFNEARQKQQQEKRKIRPHKTHIAIFAAIVILFSITVLACVVPNYTAAAKYNEEAAKLESEIAALNDESAGITKDLKNQDKLFEKIAREEYGYCKPGEKVFYNSSFGE